MIVISAGIVVPTKHLDIFSTAEAHCLPLKKLWRSSSVELEKAFN